MNRITKTDLRSNPPTSERPRAISIAILTMGGEGGGVLADWIVDLAEHSGYCAQTTSVPGVAQRTGATIYYVEIFPSALVEASGREPVLALMPVPGEVDLVIASELMEAARGVQRGLVTPDRTTLITSTHRVYSMTEKTAADDGRVNAQELLAGCQKAAKKCVWRDFARMASEHRSVISAVLFGALAGTQALAFEREQFEEAIRRGGVGVDSSLAAFAAGFEAATQDPPVLVGGANGGQRNIVPYVNPGNLAARVRSHFPASSHEILIAGIARLADYQDQSYSGQYLDRLEKVREADEHFGDKTHRLLCECGRFLALWMSYEDAIRVADLKTRLARFERVKQDSQARPGQLLQIHEFLAPRVQEIADILPKKLGRWLLRSGWPKRVLQRLTERGRVVQSTSLRGFLQLYSLAALRPWRRRSLRFAEEQEKIELWLAQVLDLARKDYQLACAVAEFPGVLRGYGETHARGRSHFEAMMAAVPGLVRRADARVRLKRLSEAALSDENGQHFQTILLEVTA
jgi:indolepyruvate ferredoxin oxidoreductase, beta subunit